MTDPPPQLAVVPDAAATIQRGISAAQQIMPLAAQLLPSAQDDAAKLATAGQRRINVIWESTQSAIALVVTLATIYVALVLALKSKDGTAIVLLSNAFFMVSGFYFGRSNHQKTGGVLRGDQGR